MKKNLGQTKKENIQFNANKPRPEIRDNLDSRKNVEQGRKGDHVSQNKKEQGKPEKQKGNR